MPYFIQTYGDQRPDGSYYLPSSTNSLITSILSLGTFFGALSGSLVGDRLGRRYALIVYMVVFFIGVVLQTACKNVGGFAAGRVLAGLGVVSRIHCSVHQVDGQGGTSCIVPLYQSECSPRKIRGMVVSAFQFFITVGLLIAAVVVDVTKHRPNASSYQIPIAIQFIWGAIIAVGVVFLPESPRWLMMRNKNDQALHSLSRLLGQPEDSIEVKQEYASIAANLESERSIGKSTWLDCFKKDERRALQRTTTGMALQALQQLTGSKS